MVTEDAQTLSVRLLEARLRRAELSSGHASPRAAEGELAELDRLLELRLKSLAAAPAL